ncbi:MAG TPA: ribosome maturation factor RimM [Symbiobacteriaceae bacterium]
MSDQHESAGGPADLIKIGVVTGAHGLHGEIRVLPLTDFPERFATLRQTLLGPDARPTAIRFRGTVKELIICTFDGVEDRTQAEKLRGQYLQVPKSEVYPLPEGSYYIFDLIGLAVIDPEGNPLGTLVEVEHGNAAHDLYVVETAPRKRYMVPAVREFVKEIDLAKGHVVIAPIPGLLEDL